MSSCRDCAYQEMEGWELVDGVNVHDLRIGLYTVKSTAAGQNSKEYYMIYGNSPVEPQAVHRALFTTTDKKVATEAFAQTHRLLARESNLDQLRRSIGNDLNLHLEDLRVDVNLKNWLDKTAMTWKTNVTAFVTKPPQKHSVIVLNRNTGEARGCQLEDYRSVMRRVTEESLFAPHGSEMDAGAQEPSSKWSLMLKAAGTAMCGGVVLYFTT